MASRLPEENYMNIPRRLFFLIVTTALFSALTHPVSAHEDDLQMAWANQPATDRCRIIGVLAICAGAGIFCAGIGVTIWSQVAAKRRASEFAARSTAAIAESSAQNKRIIELLESIDRKTPGAGT
jgi:hypothetical protein